MKTVVVCGASGYVGQHLLRTLESNGVDIRTIGRGRTSDATWSDEHGVADVLSGADLLVNLAGRSVSCRYNKRNADDIFSSRVETTHCWVAHWPVRRSHPRSGRMPALARSTEMRGTDRWTRRTESWVRDSP